MTSFLSFFILCQQPAHARVAIGVLSSFKGEVGLEREGKPIPLSLNMPINSKDRIKVEKGAAVVRFSDNSTISLRSDTEITLDQLKRKRKFFGLWSKTYLSRLINIVRGTVSGDIKKNKSLATEFQTQTVVAAVRGTTPTISIDPNTGEISCSVGIGSMQVFEKSGWSVLTLTTGQKVGVYVAPDGTFSVNSYSGTINVQSGDATTTVETGDQMASKVDPETGAATVKAIKGDVEVKVGDTIATINQDESMAGDVDADTGLANVKAVEGQVEVKVGDATVTLDKNESMAGSVDADGNAEVAATGGSTIDVTAGGQTVTLTPETPKTTVPKSTPDTPATPGEPETFTPLVPEPAVPIAPPVTEPPPPPDILDSSPV